MKLFLKGDRCYSDKCAIDRRPDQTPGDLKQRRRPKVTDYGIRLREKQKVKRMYGLTEHQFKRFFEQANKSKGVTGELLITYLESRLDNVAYRLGFSSSRNEGRQLVRLGHIRVNGRRVNIPSFLVKPGDTVEVAPKSREIGRINRSMEMLARRGFPDWLELDVNDYKGVIKRLPVRDDVTVPIQEQLIVEFYAQL